MNVLPTLKHFGEPRVTAESSDESVGSFLQANPFTLHIVIRSIVNIAILISAGRLDQQTL